MEGRTDDAAYRECLDAIDKVDASEYPAGVAAHRLTAAYVYARPVEVIEGALIALLDALSDPQARIVKCGSVYRYPPLRKYFDREVAEYLAAERAGWEREWALEIAESVRSAHA